MSEPEPAHRTKHVPALPYAHRAPALALVLAQSDDGASNGTTLWLAAQVLALCLPPPRPAQRRPRAVDLGSGVGLTAPRISLVLGALGYDVLATDTRHVCDSVLRRNVAADLPHLPSTAGSIQVRELDWNVESDRWRWDDPMCITPRGDASNAGGARAEHMDLLGPPFDLIVSSDTLYDVSLVRPFFRTVQALAASSRSSERPRPVHLLLGLERRDPEFIDEALACAPVRLRRVPTRKVRRALERAGVHWSTSDWAGVEIWTGQLEA